MKDMCWNLPRAELQRHRRSKPLLDADSQRCTKLTTWTTQTSSVVSHRSPFAWRRVRGSGAATCAAVSAPARASCDDAVRGWPSARWVTQGRHSWARRAPRCDVDCSRRCLSCDARSQRRTPSRRSGRSDTSCSRNPRSCWSGSDTWDISWRGQTELNSAYLLRLKQKEKRET